MTQSNLPNSSTKPYVLLRRDRNNDNGSDFSNSCLDILHDISNTTTRPNTEETLEQREQRYSQIRKKIFEEGKRKGKSKSSRRQGSLKDKELRKATSCECDILPDTPVPNGPPLTSQHISTAAMHERLHMAAVYTPTWLRKSDGKAIPPPPPPDNENWTPYHVTPQLPHKTWVPYPPTPPPPPPTPSTISANKLQPMNIGHKQLHNYSSNATNSNIESSSVRNCYSHSTKKSRAEISDICDEELFPALG